MQVRKRAKSVSFGKAKKEKEKEVEKPQVVEQKPTLTHAAKKVQEFETQTPPPVSPEPPEIKETPSEVKEEKTAILSDNLSSDVPSETTSPEIIAPTPEPETSTATPPSSFLSDTTTPAAVTPPDEKEASVDTSSMIVEPAVSTQDSAAVISPDPAASIQPTTPPSTPDLSPTPPSSAFTLQEGGSGEGRKKNVILYFCIVALVSFALGLGVMAAISHYGLLPNKLPSIALDPNALTNLNPMKPSPTPEPTKAPTPTPTEKPVDIKAYKISVLNGSGVRGKAVEVRTSLTTAGFNVITAGNADRSDYQTTQVVAKKSVPQEYLDKLEAELKKSFAVDTLSSMPDEANQTADVIITIGKKPAN